MEVSVLFFGQLAETTGDAKLTLRDIPDTEALREVLKERFPLLDKQKFVMAVNRKIVNGKVPLSASAEVALLPPFSGG